MQNDKARSGRLRPALGGLAAGLVVGAVIGALAWQQLVPSAQTPVVETPSADATTPSEQPSPSVTPSTPSVTPTTTRTSRLAPGQFPTKETTGVPAGWKPKTERTGDYTITDDGAVVEDLRLTNGRLYVRAYGVTLRRIELVDARIINDYGRTCYNGLRIEDSTIRRGSGVSDMPSVESGGYTAVGLQVDGPPEGLRAGEKASGCDPVLIEDSWLRMEPPRGCKSQSLWHGDGFQGYQGPAVTIRNTYINLAETKSCPGTAAFFYYRQGNTHATIDNVVMAGGPFVFRLGTPGEVSGLKIVADSWGYGPVDVADCSEVKWGSDNEIVRAGSNGTWQSVAPLRCTSP